MVSGSSSPGTDTKNGRQKWAGTDTCRCLSPNLFAQGGAEVDECAVLVVECAKFGLKGREEPSLKRLPKHVYGLKGFVESLLHVFNVNIITYCGAIF